ncbi:MAG TPA: hypothetical protein VMQ76_13250 [Terracidiphilus sp.]|nr:hypothetical protein [Terracidiphilus sp.]
MKSFILGQAVKWLAPAIAQSLSSAEVTLSLQGLQATEKLPTGFPSRYDAQEAATWLSGMARWTVANLAHDLQLSPDVAAALDKALAACPPRIPVERALPV